MSLCSLVGPPVFLVPEGGRQVLAALVLSPHLAVGQRWRGVAGGACQRHVQEAGPRLKEVRYPRTLTTSSVEKEDWKIVWKSEG